jgi:histidinol-phosphatase
MTSFSRYADELFAALFIAQAVGDYQIHNRPALDLVARKVDGSPYTDVDIESERRIKEYLMARFPADGFLGEESGVRNSSSGRKWIVDPLDGTRAYLRHIPTFSILLALELEDTSELVVSVAHFPALKETYYAVTGCGAYCNNRRLHTSTQDYLVLSMGAFLGFLEVTSDASAELLTLMRSVDYCYGFMDAYSYMGVAAGRHDLCVSLIDAPWDRAAAALIISEAGGVYSNLSGTRTWEDEFFVATNGHLHQAVLDYFHSIPPSP